MSEYKQEKIETPDNYHQSSSELGGAEDEGINVINFWTVLWENKWLIMAATCFSILIGQAYCFIATPSYKADSLIQVETKRMNTLAADMNRMTSLNGSEYLIIPAEIEILLSRMVLGKVVENLHLDQQALPKYFPLLGEPMARRFKSSEYAVAEPWFNLTRYAWGGEKIALETFVVPDSLLGVNLTLVTGKEGRFELLDPEEKVLLDGEVGKRAQRDMGNNQSLQLFISTLKARQGTRFVLQRKSQLAAINTLKGNFSVKDKNQLGTLELTLHGKDPLAVENTLNKIVDVYLRQNVEYQSEEAEKRLEFLEKQLPMLQDHLNASERAYNVYRQKLGTVDLEAETGALLNSIVTLESEIRTLELKKGELQLKLMPSHPQIILLDSAIRQTRTAIDALNKKMEKLPDTQQELFRFERDVKVDTQMYTSMLNSLQELRVTKAGTIGTIRIIDHALPPLSPEIPQPSFVNKLSLVGGLFLGILMAFVRNAFLTKGVKDPDQVEQALALPVYASIFHSEEQNRLVKKRWGGRGKGHQPKQDTSVLLAHEEKNALAVESLRSLRTSLKFAMLNTRRNSILILGPSSQVGKTFITVNLGIVFAQSGKRVLLLDADMRIPKIHKYFGAPPNLGLSDYINKDIEFEAVIKPTLVEGLDIIQAGTFCPNPSEILMHDRFASLLKQIENRYELVLIDSPPVLAATDAVILGQLAGATLMVVKSGEHPMRELLDTSKRLKQNGVNLRGVIFNEVPLMGRGYGYYNYGQQYQLSKKEYPG